MMPSAEEKVASCVGALGFSRSRLHPASSSVPESSAAVMVVRIMSPRMSVGEARTDRPGARNRIGREVEAAIGRGGAGSLRVLAEDVHLGVVPAVVGPDEQVAAGDREVDALREH